MNRFAIRKYATLNRHTKGDVSLFASLLYMKITESLVKLGVRYILYFI